jgi:hypothetical protein
MAPQTVTLRIVTFVIGDVCIWELKTEQFVDISLLINRTELVRQVP